MVFWITGKANAGKTTLAYRLQKELSVPSVILDGDEFRGMIDFGFTDDGRHKNILTIAKLASLIEKQGFIVIISLISPKREWRNEARSLFEESILIYVEGGKLWKGTTYEEPDEDEVDIIYNWRK